MKNWFGHMGQQGIRVVLLLAIIVASGIGLGLAAGVPLSQIKFEESDSIRLDQSSLAGKIDSTTAVVAIDELPAGWEPGDPGLAAFGLLGTGFCGNDVTVPTMLSDKAAVVFANPADESFLISEAVRVESWQAARDYVEALGDASSDCEQFFRTGFGGERVKVDVREGSGDAPITDHVSRTMVIDDGNAIQTWSAMALGDVVITMLYQGPARPQEGFLTGLEDQLLARVDPADFAAGGTTTSTTTTTEVLDPTATTIIDDGAADETEAGDQPPEAETPIDGGEPGP